MKIKEILNKYKRELSVAAVIIALASVIGIAGNSCTDEEVIEEQAIKEEEQVPTPEYVSPIEPEEEPEPEYTPPVENQASDMEMARQLIEPSIQESMGHLNYKIVENGDQLILVLDFKAEELSYVTEHDWSQLKNSAIYAQTNWQDVFDSAGLSIKFRVFVGDISRDRMYLAASDGQIIYDVFEDSSNDLQLENM